MYIRKLIFLILTATAFQVHLFSQDPSALTADEIDAYKEQSKQLIDFLEGTLNFLGDPNEVPSEKDIIINQSFAKMFQSDETQIEDDLDPNREMTLNKDVQAYLKDVDFFFKQVQFAFEINAVDQLVSENGQVVFKISLNRNLKGITVNLDTIENNQVRYVEINLNPVQKDLKIASIYTTKPDQREELRYWWKNMAESWKNYFGESIIVYDTLPFPRINDFTDSALIIKRWAEDPRIDTMLAYKGDTIYLDRAADSVLLFGDTLLFSTMHYLRVSDTIPVDVSVIFKNLMTFKSATKVDVAWNLNINNLNPLTELTELKEIYFSNTLVDDVSPLRNHNDLEVIVCSGSKIKSLDPLRYASNLKEINCLATGLTEVNVLANLKNLNKLNIGETAVTNIDTLSGSESISQLDLSDLQLDGFEALKDMSGLTDLNLSGTNIQSLEALAGLTSLSNLNIGNTQISDISPLKQLPSLSILQANYSAINNLGPLDGMENIKYIYCDNTGIDRNKAQRFMASNPGSLVVYNTEELRQWWYELPPIYKSITKERIDISEPVTTEQLHTIIKQTDVNLSGYKEINDIKPLQMLHRIEKLNLENTSVEDLSPLSGLNNLTHLNIDNTRVKTLKPLEQLQNLRTLKCRNTLVDDLVYLSKHSNLDRIYCDGTRVDQRNVLALIDILPACLIIYQSEALMNWWDKLDQTWQTVFKDQMKSDGEMTPEKLQTLVNMEKVEIYDHAAINNLLPLNKFLQLQSLTVSNSRVSDISPVKDLPKLKELNLPNNPIIEVPGITAFKALEKLNLENTPIEDLQHIGNISWLLELNIAGTKIKKLKGIEGMINLEKLMINNTEIKKLKEVESLYNLKELVCYRTAINSKTIEEFRSRFPGIEVNYY